MSDLNADSINIRKSYQLLIEEQVALIKEQVGDKKVLLALSGGVDSSVVSANCDHVYFELFYRHQ